MNNETSREMSHPASSAFSSMLSPLSSGGVSAARRDIMAARTAGHIGEPDQVSPWIAGRLAGGGILQSTIFMAQAHKSESDQLLAELSALSVAILGGDMGQEALLRGAQFVERTRNVWGIDLPDMSLPIAAGFTAKLMDVPLEAALSSFVEAEVDGALILASQLVGLTAPDAKAAKLGLAQNVAEAAKRSASSSLEDVFAAGGGDALSDTTEPAASEPASDHAAS